MDTLFLNEASLPQIFWSREVKEVLNKTPVVSKAELLRQARPGDLLVPNTPKKKIINAFHEFSGLVNKFFQRGPYTSLKMVGNDGELIGYGVKKSMGDGIKLDKITLHGYLSATQEAALVRMKGVTPEQAQEAVDYMEFRLKSDFRGDALIKTVWNRLFDRKAGAFYEDFDPKRRKEALEFADPLFCSSVVAYAYYAVAGIKMKDHIFDTWPVDFITSKHTQVVCRID